MDHVQGSTTLGAHSWKFDAARITSYTSLADGTTACDDDANWQLLAAHHATTRSIASCAARWTRTATGL